MEMVLLKTRHRLLMEMTDAGLLFIRRRGYNPLGFCLKTI